MDPDITLALVITGVLAFLAGHKIGKLEAFLTMRSPRKPGPFYGRGTKPHDHNAPEEGAE